MKDLESVQIVCHCDRTGRIWYSGIRLLDTVSEVEITVDEDGKVEIAGIEEKHQFLDLMSKLYDMAEVK